MKVEMFVIPGCSECVAARARLRAAAQEVVKNLDWRELNVLDDLDYAVELGVMTLPSIMVFPGMKCFGSLIHSSSVSSVQTMPPDLSAGE